MKSSPLLVSLLLLAGCLTFFFPLLTLQVPLLGTQDFSGYDLLHRSGEFDRTAQAMGWDADGQGEGAHGEEANIFTQARSNDSMPLSLDMLHLVPSEVFLAFGLTVAALFFCVFQAAGAARVLALLGAILAVLVFLHVTVANSDLHSWMSQKLATSSLNAGAPFALFANGIAGLALASFQIRAGAGLYGLAGCLSFASILLFSSGSGNREKVDDDGWGKDSPLKRPTVVLGSLMLVAAILWFFVLNRRDPRARTTFKVQQSTYAPNPDEIKRLVGRLRNQNLRLEGSPDDAQALNLQFENGEAKNDTGSYTLDTDHIAFGDLDGDGKLDALVVLGENGGGSGYFESLIGILDIRGAQTPTVERDLGDRVVIRAMAINNRVARVSLLTQGPEDGMCCPTEKTARRFRLRGNQFVDAAR